MTKKVYTRTLGSIMILIPLHFSRGENPDSVLIALSYHEPPSIYSKADSTSDKTNLNDERNLKIFQNTASTKFKILKKYNQNQSLILSDSLKGLNLSLEIKSIEKNSKKYFDYKRIPIVDNSKTTIDIIDTNYTRLNTFREDQNKLYLLKKEWFQNFILSSISKDLETKYNELLSIKAEIRKHKLNQISLRNEISSLDSIIANSFDLNKYIPPTFSLKLDELKFRVILIDSSKLNLELQNNSSGKLTPLKTSWDYFSKNFKTDNFAIMNAGMFEENGMATGLLVEKSIQKKRIDTFKKGDGNFYMQPNGVFYKEKNGGYGVLSTANFLEKYYSTNTLNEEIYFATQSGPMLLNDSQINPQFSLNSSNLNLRNGVGIILKNTKSKIVVLAISDSKVNFYDFALLFKEILGCENALYLDGAISKMYIKGDPINKLDGKLGPKIIVFKK